MKINKACILIINGGSSTIKFALYAADKSLDRLFQDKYHLKIAVINNEARELNEYRIKKFQLNQFVDFFISSCFVHLRKPDAGIFRLALDIAQVSPENVLYIDDTPMFVNIANSFGIRGIKHQNYLSTSAELASLGLSIK